MVRCRFCSFAGEFDKVHALRGMKGKSMGVLEYHRSINDELSSVQNRIRNLLEPKVHWAEDGRHKEVILRQVLHRHLSSDQALCTGFVKLRESCSTQLDIMLTNSDGPVLFREGDFQIVTPNLVEAVIEVKTRVTATSLRDAVLKLADTVSSIRKEKIADQPITARLSKTDPWAGLFIFDDSEITPELVVEIFKEVSDQRLDRSIQAMCLGPNKFLRFWTTSPDPMNPIHEPAWHLYELDGLAFSYFIGNALWRDSDNSSHQRHWFPLVEGKEVHMLANSKMEAPYS